ncbi:MAG TPA: hypothetical protein VNU44_09915 [Bryobacteraceae bacterium]|jgi:hypothetical protein|nr:hypothetical protein [Bryobacteraceae bacterium]
MYNERTLKTVASIGLAIAIGIAACFLIITSIPSAPRNIYPGGLIAPVLFAPPGSAEKTKIVPAIQGRLDERFITAWPKGLTVGTHDSVVVRIAANDYENLLKGIDEFSREIVQERFKGRAELEVTLKGDSGLEIMSQHGDKQVVVRGQHYREWSWTILPKLSGTHRLSLLVQGVQGNIREDYDPQIKDYAVAMDWVYWLKLGAEQNGVGYVWAAVFGTATFFLGRLFGKKSKQEDH